MWRHLTSFLYLLTRRGLALVVPAGGLELEPGASVPRQAMVSSRAWEADGGHGRST
jgi:hypothetical protein